MRIKFDPMLNAHQNSKSIVTTESTHLTELKCKNKSSTVNEIVEFKGADLGFSYLSGNGKEFGEPYFMCSLHKLRVSLDMFLHGRL